MSQRIDSLDGLRALAIMLVLAAHAGTAFSSLAYVWWMAPMLNGSFGVRLFFVLSGYLITRLLIREQAEHGGLSLTRFYARRTLRIFPAFYLYFAVVCLLAWRGQIETSRTQIAVAASYTWNYAGLWDAAVPAEGAWFLGHLWTLSLEEQFYLVWPGLIVLSGWRAAKVMTLVVPLALPVMRVLIYHFFPAQRGWLGMTFHTGIDSILIGCAFALWSDPLKRVLLGRTAWGVAGLFALVGSPLLSHALKGAYNVTIGFGLDAICSGVLILNAQVQGHLMRALSIRPLCLVGTWSYSLYLWQQLFLTGLDKPWTSGLLGGLLCTFACALVSYYAVETPCLRWKRRFERPQGGQATAATARQP